MTDFYDTLLAGAIDGGGGGGSGWTGSDVATGVYPDNLDVVFYGDKIQYYAFAGSNIKSFYAPNCTNMIQESDPAGRNASDTCVFCGSDVETIDMPVFIRTRDRFALGCKKLTSVKLPIQPFVGGNAFAGCSNLPLFVGQSATIVYTSAFQNCAKLEIVDVLGGDTSSGINANAFNGCSIMTVLVLRASTVTKLGNISAFTNSPFASGKSGGTLYVPSAQISAYQSASNWSTILGYTNNQIKSIESTHTDPDAPIDLTLYYADGTPIGG